MKKLIILIVVIIVCTSCGTLKSTMYFQKTRYTNCGKVSIFDPMFGKDNNCNTYCVLPLKPKTFKMMARWEPSKSK